MTKPNLDHTPTDTELKDNAQELAWLAICFFQALLKGEAAILVQHTGFRPGQDFTSTRISLEWTGKTQEETV